LLEAFDWFLDVWPVKSDILKEVGENRGAHWDWAYAVSATQMNGYKGDLNFGRVYYGLANHNDVIL